MKNGSDRDFRSLIYSMLSFATLMLRSREYFAAHIGVTGPQYSMMAVIAESGRATIGEIAIRMNVASPFVTTEIGKLIKKDIVQKMANETDRRSVIVTLTAKGKNLIRDLAPLRCTVNDNMYRSLTPARAAALADIMRDLIADSSRALYELDAPRQRGGSRPSR